MGMELLGEIRMGTCSDAGLAKLQACSVGVKALPDDGVVPTRLYCMNADVDAENRKCLAELDGESCLYKALDTFVSVYKEQAYDKLPELADKRASRRLELKVGAQVVLTRNLGENLVNGSRGLVLHLGERPVVRFDCGEVRHMEHMEFFQATAGVGQLSRRQFPLQLAWALTVHKSQ